MEGVTANQNCFLIDLCKLKVFCRACRRLCMKELYSGYMLFWCANRKCKNSGDVRLYPDGKWEVYRIVESYSEMVSTLNSKLLFTIKTGHSVLKSESTSKSR